MIKKALHNSQPYDPRQHITAGELRGLGFYLSEMLPDWAFVRRIAVGLDPDEALGDDSATLSLRVLEPFRVGEPVVAVA